VLFSSFEAKYIVFYIKRIDLPAAIAQKFTAAYNPALDFMQDTAASPSA